MLGKLIKHEFYATARMLLPLYAVLAVFTLLNRFILLSNPFNGNGIGIWKVIEGFCVAIYVFLLVAVLVITLVLLVMRFYKNLLGDEGYLMFTLPASPSQLVHAKLLNALAVLLVSVLVILASLCGALLDGTTWIALKDSFWAFWHGFNQAFEGNVVAFWIQIAVVAFLSVTQTILLTYASLSIGQLFNRHRLAASIGAYIALTTALQILMGVMMVVVGTSSGIDWENTTELPSFLLPTIIGVQFVTTSIFYGGTRYILKNKLNLE